MFTTYSSFSSSLHQPSILGIKISNTLVLDSDAALILWYKFNNGDISGSNLKNYGTQSTATSTINDTTSGSVISSAVTKVGSTSLYSTTGTSGFRSTFIFPSNSYSFSFWKYITSLTYPGPNNLNSYGNFLRTDSPYETDLWLGTGPKLYFYTNGGEALPSGTGFATPLVINTWSHFVINYDSSINTTTFYINNVLDATSANAHPFKPNAGISTSMGVDGTGRQVIPGYLADFRLFSRILTTSERALLYAKTSY